MLSGIYSIGKAIGPVRADRRSIRGGSSIMTISPTVLVIDDDPLLLILLERKLGMKGYRVITASDGTSGLAQARSAKPDLIVLDMMMPVMNGAQVLQAIQADPELSSTPVVMLTARRGESDVVGAIEAGAADYLSKPFSPDELLARISRLITIRKAMG